MKANQCAGILVLIRMYTIVSLMYFNGLSENIVVDSIKYLFTGRTN